MPDEVLDSILAVGQATGVPARAGRLATELRAWLAQVAAQLTGQPRPKVAVVGGWTAVHRRPLGPGSGDRRRRHASYGRRASLDPVSWTEIAAAAPDLAVVAPRGYHLAGAAEQAHIAAGALPGLPIWAIDADGIVPPGPG